MKSIDIKRVAILGGGQLGQMCYEMFKKETDFKVRLYSHKSFDICNESDVISVVSSNDLIINCAAFTNVDLAEVKTRECLSVNGIAVEFLAKEIAKQNKFLVHISSDFVYGNIEMISHLEELSEDFILNPINVYGESKMMGENNILSWMSKRFLILRVSWLFGPHGNNFVEKIYQQLLDPSVKCLKVVNDQHGRPTSTETVVKVILYWLAIGFPHGFYNLSCSGPAVTKYDVATFMNDYLNTDKKIISVSSADFPQVAIRQKNSILNCSKIDQYLLVDRPSWTEEVAKYLDLRQSQLNKPKSWFRALINWLS